MTVTIAATTADFGRPTMHPSWEAPMLKVQRFGQTVFVTDMSVGDPRHGLTIYAEKFATKRQARTVSDRLCQEIAAGLPRNKLSIAADIEKRLEALRFLPPNWR